MSLEELNLFSRVQLLGLMTSSSTAPSIHEIFQARITLSSWLFLQKIFLRPGLNPGLPHCGVDKLYCLSHQGSTSLAKSLQSSPLLHCIDGSHQAPSAPSVIQARTPREWAMVSFSTMHKVKSQRWSRCQVWPLATPWTAAHRAVHVILPDRSYLW